jgi:hypothetical protein
MTRPTVAGAPDNHDPGQPPGAPPQGARPPALRASGGRYASAANDHEVLDALGRALGQMQGDPTMTATEAVLAELGYRGPGLRALMARFGARWANLRSLALADHSERARLLGSFQHRGEFTGTEEDMIRGVRMVAHRLKRVPLPVDYDLMVAEIHAEWRAQGIEDPPWLAASATILARMPWPTVLERAGLVAPAHHRTSTESPMERMVEAVIACLEELGVLPSANLLRAWAQARDVELPGHQSRPPWPEVIAEVRRRRNEEGKPTPERQTLPRHAPPIPADPARPGEPAEAPERPLEPISGVYISLEDAVVSVARYLVRYCGPTRSPNTRHYRNVRKHDPEIASYTSLTQHEHFHDLVARAERLIAKLGREAFARPGATIGEGR